MKKQPARRARHDLSVGTSVRNINVSPEGAVKTLTAARDLIRQLSREEREAQPIQVLVQAGDYFLTEPFILTAADSGTPAAPITYCAVPEAEVRISGGRRLTGWKRTSHGKREAWILDIPEVRAGAWYFTQLFVNGLRRQRSRLPRKGFYKFRDVERGQPSDRAVVHPGDLCPGWYQLEDVEVVVPHYWLDSHLFIKEINDATGQVIFRQKSVRPLDDEKRVGTSRYWVENVFEALAEPGQWYLDRSTGRLTYLPFPDEDLATAEIVAPALPYLLRIQGETDSEVAANAYANPGHRVQMTHFPPSRPQQLEMCEQRTGQAVHDLHIDGLKFCHTEWSYPQTIAGAPQAAYTCPGAVQLNQARDCSLRRCTIAHVGTYAVDLETDCLRIEIVANHLTDLGAGGIKLSHGTHFNRVCDNRIQSGGRRFASAIGIWIGHSSDNLVTHNHIADFYYTGISAGWVWGYSPSPARRNIIAYNHIHKIGQGLLSDMGGIYSLGVAPGTRICHNLIHDVRCYSYGGNGLYPDEGTAFLLYENNIVYNVDSGTVHMNYGRDNLFRNNLLLNSKDAQIAWGTPKYAAPFRFENNVVCFAGGTVVSGDWFSGLCQLAFERNVYWDTEAQTPDFGGSNWQDWQARGLDMNGRACDPKVIHDKYLVNGESCPGLADDSAAFKVGFKRIEPAQIGPRHEILESGRSIDEIPACGPLVWASITPDKDAAAYDREVMLFYDYPEQAPCRIAMRACFENAGDAYFAGTVRITATPTEVLGTAVDCREHIRLSPGASHIVKFELDVLEHASEIALSATCDEAGFWPASLALAFRQDVKVPFSKHAQSFSAAKSLTALCEPVPVLNGRHFLGHFQLAMTLDTMLLAVVVKDTHIELAEPVYKGSMVDIFIMGSSATTATGQVAEMRGQLFLAPAAGEVPARLLTADGVEAPGAEVHCVPKADGYEILAAMPLSLLNIDPSAGSFGFDGAIYTHVDESANVLRAHTFNQRSPMDVHSYGRMILNEAAGPLNR